MNNLKIIIEKLLLLSETEDTQPPFRCLPEIDRTVANIKADRIVSELQQTIEDAEKWRRMSDMDKLNEKNFMVGQKIITDIVEILTEKASQFDKIFEGLVVEEKCLRVDDYECFDPRCVCQGTGTVSRLLTEEEKVEAFEEIMKIMDSFALCSFLIKSGARVARK